MNFEISVQDLAIIQQGLGELPLKYSGPVLARLMQQQAKALTPEPLPDLPESHSDKQF